MQKLKLFHGSPIKNLNELKIINNDKYNDLGYGIYVSDEQFAKPYSKNGSIYQVLVKLNKALKLDEKNINMLEMTNIVEQLFNENDINIMLLKYYKKETHLQKASILNMLTCLYKDCNNDNHFFNELFIINEKFVSVFEYMGFTHTYSTPNGYPEWCLLPGAIIATKEIQQKKENICQEN